MRYTALNIGENEYKLRLSTGEVVRIEKVIGGSIFDIFDGDGIPTMGNLMLLFHASLQKFQHKVNLETAYEIYDTYVDVEEGCMEDLLEILMEVLEVSGFFKRNQIEKAKAETEAENQAQEEN